MVVAFLFEQCILKSFTSEPDLTVTETADFDDRDMLYKSHYWMQCR